MANPQKENGHTPLANELIDQFCEFRIPGELWQVLFSIIRKTYGWNKKEDRIAHSQIMEMTGMKKGNVSRSLSKLITHNIIIKSDNKLSLNKDYETWIKFGVIKSDKNKSVIKSETIVINTATKVIKSDKNLLSEVIVTKDNKDTIQKTLYKRQVTPSQQMKSFVNSFEQLDDNYYQLLEYLKQNGINQHLAETELSKFINYWTELNKSGTKQRWEMEKTFEVKRRLTTWFSRIKTFNKERVGKNYDN
jgi:phage replication O-like protein O